MSWWNGQAGDRTGRGMEVRKGSPSHDRKVYIKLSRVVSYQPTLLML